MMTSTAVLLPLPHHAAAFLLGRGSLRRPRSPLLPCPSVTVHGLTAAVAVIRTAVSSSAASVLLVGMILGGAAALQLLLLGVLE